MTGGDSRSGGDSRLGADVDPDPLKPTGPPIVLNADESGTAALYVRYRLYSHQPDEMIVWRAIAGMSPARSDFDPRLYQYGGLFIYPVAALLKACSMLGWIDLRADLGYYLDHPDAFGKFYVVSRAYSAAWGAAASLIVFAIARRLGGNGAGVLASALFIAMPVVVCMAHEGKPHLPGAALMLLAVLFAQQCLSATMPYGACVAIDDRSARMAPSLARVSTGESRPMVAAPGERDTHVVEHGAAWTGREPRTGRRSWWGLCATCGAATGMVLSSLPIVALIPLTAWWRAAPARRRGARWLGFTIAGLGVALVVYLMTNPYVVINLFINRDVLRSNFGNSVAMYEVGRLGEGARRVVELTVEGATPAPACIGIAGALLMLVERRRAARPLLASASVMLCQFILIGAGKPAEYGRFGVFVAAALAITSACVLVRAGGARGRRRIVGHAAMAIVLGLTVLGGQWYLVNFIEDAATGGTRWAVADAVSRLADASAGDDDRASVGPRIVLLREPAPYNCPPLRFDRWPVILVPTREAIDAMPADRPIVLIEAVDDLSDGGSDDKGWQIKLRGAQTPISWANKPFVITVRPARSDSDG